MDSDEFRRAGHQLIDWIADYWDGIEELPVRAQVEPGDILAELPPSAPEQPETMATIFADVDRVIMPGITHWQHPMFMAYFPAISSPPAVLAELLAAGLGTQGMMWETSPAATELEIRVLDWLRQALGLPDGLHGVIQDTASTSTLCAAIAARERARANGAVLAKLTAYGSVEAHSSVEKAARLAGFEPTQFRAIPTDANWALDPAALDAQINADRAAGLTPAFCVATLGATALGGFDDLTRIGAVCRRHGVWLHVDAAWAGSALILPEQRWMSRGIDAADSLVVNPHKWLFTTVDCSVLYVRDPAAYTEAFSILPEYLKTAHAGAVTDYRDWGIALGRRFRALKLWFVFRRYGLEGLRARLRDHIALAQGLADQIAAAADFELLVKPKLALLVFRYHPAGVDAAGLDRLNETLLAQLNDSGAIYLTRAKVRGAMAIRVSVGQARLEAVHLERAWTLIRDTARGLQQP